MRSHDSFICRTWLIYMWDMTHWYVGHVSFISGTWLIFFKNVHEETPHLCMGRDSFFQNWGRGDMTYLHVGMPHDSFICETWLIYTQYDSFSCGTWPIFSRLGMSRHDSFILGMTHLYKGYDTFICETCFIYLWNVTCFSKNVDEVTWLNLCVGHDTSACGTRLIHMWNVTYFSKDVDDMRDMTHSYVGHDSSYVGNASFIFGTWLVFPTLGRRWHDSCICGPWFIHMRDMHHSYVEWASFFRQCGSGDMTHSHVGHDSFTCGAWLIHMWDMTHL